MATQEDASVTPPLEQGILIFNKELTSDPKKKISITSPSNNSQHAPCKLEDLLATAGELQKERDGKRSRTRLRVERVIKTINEHSKVIDVLIQQQPDITAVVWGAFRFLIGVATRDIDTSDKISDALVFIVRSLGRWNKYFELFTDFGRVNRAAGRLFSQIINFSVRAKIFFQKRSAVRQIKVGFSTWTQKLDGIMELIREASHELEIEANLASEQRRERDRRAHEDHATLTRNEFGKQTEMSNDIIKSLEREKVRREHLQVVDWLNAGRPSPRLKTSVEHGTCRWIRDSDVWSNWAADNYKRPLRICGPPGTGKTTIASHLFKSAETEIALIYYFESSTRNDTTTSKAFAASLLHDVLQHELVQATEHYHVVIQQLLSIGTKRIINVSFSQLWLIISQFLPKLPNLTLIVDGLDECEGILSRIEKDDRASWSQLVSGLNKLTSSQNVRLISTFRNHPRLAESFADSLQIQLGLNESMNDIKIYVDAEIERHGMRLQKLKKEIVDTIMSLCKGMFLWAEMMLESLTSAHSYEEQLACLANPPPDLYSFYERLISERSVVFSVQELTLRRKIFVLLVGLNEYVTSKELLYLLSLDTIEDNMREKDAWIDAEATVLHLCWPLVRISEGLVQFMHLTAKDFLSQPTPATIPSIHITSDEADATLALKCLLALCHEKYRSTNTIAILIRRNVGSTEDSEDPHFYQYSATHWYIHLIAVHRPEKRLVEQTARFLMGYAFVSWSEYIFQTSGSQGTMLEVESKLKMWRETLPSELQNILVLVGYFSKPYRAVATFFQEDGGDNTLPYMTLFQLGEYFNLAARGDEAFEIKQTVAEGLVNLLGERNPLALKAQSTFAWEYMNQNRLPEAEAAFRKLAQLQKEVLGEEKPDTFVSLQRQGCAELYMTKFADADLCLTQSLSGFLNTVGVKSFFYLLSQMAIGQVSEYQGEILRALLDYEHVWRYRTSLLGQDNPMAVWAYCCMVSTYRKLKRYEEAGKAVDQVIDSRTRSIGAKSPGTIDAIIHKALLYLDMDRLSDVMELVDLIIDGGLVENDFERSVQITHIRAISEYFTQGIDVAIDTLQSIVIQSTKKGVDGRVRSMLWVREDLAIMLRKQGRNDEAMMLFDELVTSIDSDSSSSWEITDSPRELIISERALRLVRRMRLDEARLLLERNGLKWSRQKDFWILNGNPPADTAWMRGPETRSDEL
ncbi:hypothetical protein B0J14DRAFT_573414 [Halenospora varia]|nr:hypothetical protein B0J14DRAFT_573414 [Halenospora varia]